MLLRVTEYGVIFSVLVLLAGCDQPYSMLEPAGPAAKEIAIIWWAMLAVGTLVLLGVCGLWAYAIYRRHRRYSDTEVKRILHRMIFFGGIALPSVSIALLLLFGIPAGNSMLSWPNEDVIRIDVQARQWAWDVTYPSDDFRLTDEIHIPINTPVDFHITSVDVIHSFWVPRLGGKIDAIPGHMNVIRLQADAAGTYAGLCAEYCGRSHTYMHFKVIAHTKADFDAWRNQQRKAHDDK